MTAPSDIELYERRTWYWFHEGTPQSPYLPERDSPEEQVEHASLYEFFRLVYLRKDRWSGERRLHWHKRELMPIVQLRPLLNVREGADFLPVSTGMSRNTQLPCHCSKKYYYGNLILPWVYT